MPYEAVLEKINDRKQNPSLLRRLLPSFLSDFLLTDPEELEDRHHRRREKVQDSFRPLRVETGNALVDAEFLWNDLEAGGTVDIEELDSMRSELEDCKTRLDSLVSEDGDTPDGSLYLKEEELAQLSDLQESVDETVKNFSTKIEYERIDGDVSESYERLKDKSWPYLGYEKYLNRREYADLERRFKEFADLMFELDQLEKSRLLMSDRGRISSYWQQYSSVKSLVLASRDEYNLKYIDEQAERHSDLITDIGLEKIDLNDEQRKAVFRNAKYNQIVAGAGTGKTMVLSSRIAYLLERGVDPEAIIALTFTKKAVSNINNRLSKHYGIDSVEIRTIHSLGYMLLDEAGNLPNDWIEGPENFVEEHVSEAFERLSSGAQGHYQRFLAERETGFIDKSKYETAADLIKERKERHYTTLKGEQVKSRDEKAIADFLFLHQVQYRYEAEAEWAETGEGSKVYQPDFFLPKHGIYIEHWGLNEEGQVAPYFDAPDEMEIHDKLPQDPDEVSYFDKASLKYWSDMFHKRDSFRNTDYELIDTFHFQYHNNDLWDILRRRLESHAVQLERIPANQLQERVVDAADEREIIENLTEFIQKARRNDLDSETIKSRLDTSEAGQLHFGRVGAELLHRYKRYLREEDRNDFLGMVLRSIDVVSNNERIQEKYDHLLIDEFQDISNPQARLFDSLTQGKNGPVLFAVGDDWQSIYGFRGGNPSFFIDFDEEFGPQDREVLSTNFRSTPNVVQMGNEVIRKNSNQIDKNVSAFNDEGPSPKLHSFGGGEQEYLDWSSARAAATAFEYLFQGSTEGINNPGEIMILSRYETGADYIDTTKKYLRRLNIPYEGYADSGGRDVYEPTQGQFTDSEGKVSIHSIHKSKGEEAECVIMLHMATSGQAFPPDEPDDHLLDPVEEKSIDFLEEERRLFYVGITRAKHELHLITEANNISPFVVEVSDHLRPHLTVSALREQDLSSEDNGFKRVSVELRVANLFPDKHELMAQIGLLEDETGRIRFVSWDSGDPVHMDMNNWYRIRNAKLEKYQGDFQIAIDAKSDINEINQRIGRDQFR